MLYLVATPIGNLDDISLRAIKTLNDCDYILCEDTRTSLVLLNHLNIKKPLFSYHKFNETKQSAKIIDDLKQNKNIALISDAGTPGISDPGQIIVNECIKNSIAYTVIPGACAFNNAFVLSGFDTPLMFVGFLPDKVGERKTVLTNLKDVNATTCFYVSPHKLEDTITAIYKVFGNREACLVREYTKKFEQVVHFDLKDGFDGNIKGEMVLLVKAKAQTSLNIDNLMDDYNALVNNNILPNDAMKMLAKKYNLAKSEIYKKVLASKK